MHYILVQGTEKRWLFKTGDPLIEVTTSAGLLIFCLLQETHNQENRLENEEWFHGVLPREEVQRLLAQDGDFLVRESKNKRTNETQFVLSAYWQGYRHFIIQFHEVSYILLIF